MPVGLKPPEALLPVAGIQLAAIHSGIKSDSRIKDLVLLELAASSNLSAVFTRNRFCAAPVVLARKHLSDNNQPRYLLINSGNANAGTGTSGYSDAVSSCRSVAELTGVSETAVLPFSTGVIAARLPVEKIEQAMPRLYSQLDANNWLAAAEGIMTTDILPKAVSRTVQVGSSNITITGMAKGSGMIKPDMATMLAFIATDARIEQALLDDLLSEAVACSFNAITVDGDTSTNDACVLMATGSSGIGVSDSNDEFKQALIEVFQLLAQAVIRDAEGATKFVEIVVNAALTEADARAVGYAVAQSPLVKTALFASDPNWGRILAAVGRAEAESLDINRVSLFLGDTCLLKNGLPEESYKEEMGQAEMSKSEIRILIDLGLGDVDFKLWTSDLSYEYVKINAEYRS